MILVEERFSYDQYDRSKIIKPKIKHERINTDNLMKRFSRFIKLSVFIRSCLILGLIIFERSYWSYEKRMTSIKSDDTIIFGTQILIDSGQ